MVFVLASFSNSSFKDDQKKYSRVRTAYAEKESSMLELLEKNSIDVYNLQIYLRAFKTEKKIELWAKNKADVSYKLIKEFNICSISGELGPKRKQGDFQIPEGFYHINRFNPYSNFYLSLGINYPNKSDKILGVKGNLGGDIFIHGSCVTIGCLPITDNGIKELYIFCVEAKNNGQSKIPVSVFPVRLTNTNYNKLKAKYKTDSDRINLWEDLKEGYDYFNMNKALPEVIFLNNGRHQIGD